MPFSYVDGVECSGVDNSVGVWERGSVGVWECEGRSERDGRDTRHAQGKCVKRIMGRCTGVFSATTIVENTKVPGGAI